MANVTRIPVQDNYQSTLTAKLTANVADLTVYVKVAPSYSPTTTPTRGVINPGKSNMEVVKIDNYDATLKTCTIPAAGRAQSLYEGHTATVQEHASGSIIMISDNFGFWEEIQDAIASKANSSGAVFTNGMNIPVFADAAARDVAIPVPTNSMEAYLTAEGKITDYIAGAWADRASGTNPNASTIVAGKIEIATAAERAAGTATGGTGALLVPSNDALVKTPSGAADENKIPLLDATGQIPAGFISSINSIVGHSTYTPAYLTGGNAAESLFNNWLAVLDGSFRITINGTLRNVTGINFTGVTSMNDVATKIQTAIRALTTGLETVVWSVNHFIISSVLTTSSSAITVTSATGGGTDISGAGGSNWMDSDVGNGVVTNAALDPTADAGLLVKTDANGNIDPSLLNSNPFYAASSTGNDTYVVTIPALPTAYYAGMKLNVKVDVGNTGAATINVNGLGAKDIKKNVSEALITGDILAGSIVALEYDGTNFQLMNTTAIPLSHAGGSSVAGGASTVNTDVVITTGFRPSTIEISYILRGVASGGEVVTIGTANFDSAGTLRGGMQLLNNIAVGTTITGSTTSVSPTLQAGGAAGSYTIVVMSIFAISNTGYTIRFAFTNGGAGDKTSEYAYKSWK